MVRGALWKKAFRDMQKSKAQFISILIMATLTMSIVTGLDCIWKTIEIKSESMYRSTNASDLWVSIMNPSEGQMWAVSRVSGVAAVEKRFTADADTDLEGAPILKVYTLSDQSTLDVPETQEGGFRSGSGAILDTSFAERRGIERGDRFSIKLNDRWISVTVEGLAYSSEQINQSKGGAGASPNHDNFGFVFLRDDVLEGAYGAKVSNQICVKLLPGADIKQVESDIDEAMGKDLLGISARDDTNSGNSVKAFIQQFKTVSTVFPLLFFLVTALITQSTMVRLVEQQRGQIGLLKALGYSKSSILWHYTSYGLGIGLLSAFLGLLIGPRLFGGILVPRLNLTFPDYIVSVNYDSFLFSLVFILLCTGGVSLYACLKLMNETPALLLRDKPPKKGSHIFLEFLPALWQKMKFSRKLIARNTVRNTMRLIMSVLGVMGCAALIVSAFALNNMISGISTKVYGYVYKYDQKVLLDDDTDFRWVKNKQLDAATQEIEETGAEIVCPDGTHVMKPLTVVTGYSPLLALKDIDGNSVELSDNGIAVSRKLAETLKIKAGGSIQVKRLNGGYVTVPVDRIFYMAAGQGMFIKDTLYRAIGEKFDPTAVLIKWNGPPDQAFLNSDSIEETVSMSTQIKNVNSMTTVVLIAAMMMILMGAILTFVVLYNSSILNYTERIRDLATLRVLGFYQREIRALVLTENILSVFLGILFGVPLGKGLLYIIASTLDDRMDLVGSISLGNVLAAGCLTVIFALIVNRAVAKKMKNLDMLSALKSVE